MTYIGIEDLRFITQPQYKQIGSIQWQFGDIHCELVYLFILVQTGKSEGTDEDKEDELDEETAKKDQLVKGAIDTLIQENANELNAPSQDDESNRRKRKREKKEEVWLGCVQ